MEQNGQNTGEKPQINDQAQPEQAKFHFEDILMKRFIATFIDMVLVGVTATILIVPVMMILGKTLGAMFSFFVFSAAAAAILLKDMPYKIGELDGQTPGKKAMNIRVTDLNGNPITIQQSIQRNLIPASGYVIAAVSALINVIPLGIIAGIAGFFIILPLMLISIGANLFEIYKIFSSPQHRRIGDQMANTIVAWE
ncbi:MAG: RDD family protein [Candidatus Rifleibacteriota bacterium]